MSSSPLALQQAIFATLSTDPSLLSLLGGPRVFDVVPQPPVFPFVAFGQSLMRDGDTSSAPSDEHVITLHVWSRGPGRREALAITDAIRNALHDRPLTLAGHRLVNLRHEVSEARRDADSEIVRALVRLRAVTEPTT